MSYDLTTRWLGSGRVEPGMVALVADGLEGFLPLGNGTPRLRPQVPRPVNAVGYRLSGTCGILPGNGLVSTPPMPAG